MLRSPSVRIFATVRWTRISVVFCLLIASCRLALAQVDADVLLPIRQNGKYGFITDKGDIAIQPRFYWATTFQEGRALVYICGKYGFIDDKGNVAVPARYDSAGRSFSHGLARVEVDRKWGFINRKGEMVISPQFEEAGDFSGDGLAGAKIEGKWGYIDKRGTFVVTPRFNDLGLYSEGTAPAQVEPNGKWGFIDRRGKFVIKPQFKLACGFSEGLACVEQGEEWGYIDHTGKIVIQPKVFFQAGDFVEGRSLVVTDGTYKYGFIDKTGTLVIRARFSSAYPFSHGTAVASLNGKTGFIDRSGEWVSPPYSGEPDFISDGFVAITDKSGTGLGDEWGYMGPNGKFIWRAPVAEAPTHEMWPLVGFDESQKQEEIEKSCQVYP